MLCPGLLKCISPAKFILSTLIVFMNSKPKRKFRTCFTYIISFRAFVAKKVIIFELTQDNGGIRITMCVPGNNTFKKIGIWLYYALRGLCNLFFCFLSLDDATCVCRFRGCRLALSGVSLNNLSTVWTSFIKSETLIHYEIVRECCDYNNYKKNMGMLDFLIYFVA